MKTQEQKRKEAEARQKLYDALPLAEKRKRNSVKVNKKLDQKGPA